MNALQRTLQTIGRQLKGLPSTAKMLIGSLMIIMVMSLFLVSLYAGRKPMTPLGLSAAATPDARARAVNYLKVNNIPFDVTGSDILVPADRQFAILAQLTERQVIGADQINFESLMSDDSPFRTRDQNRTRFMVAKMNVLGGMISQMSGVERATVVLDAGEGAALGKSHIPASASVSVLTRSGDLNQHMVDAIAKLVAGSHAGLKPQNVAIIDARTGRAHAARTEDFLNAGKYMELKLEAERHAKSTLEGALRYISGVLIAVNAQVDATEMVQQTSKYDEPKIGIVDDLSEAMSSSGPGVAGPAGVQPNTGANIAAGSRSGAQTTQERTKVSSVPFVGTTESKIRDTKGYALQINATIGVPKSYFVRLYQDRQGDPEKQPTQAELDLLVQAEVERIKTDVTPLIDTQAVQGAVAGMVAVSMIPDFGAARVAPEGSTESGDSGVTGIASADAGGIIKYVSLGALAALSLGMMFMMVRKAGAREELPTASELVGIPPALAAAESDLVGEADEASPALEGLELNDDAIRRQQMLDQITEMVSSTPEEAASLLRRWMKSEA